MIQSLFCAALADERTAELRRQADHQRLAGRARSSEQLRIWTREPALLAGTLVAGTLLAAIGLLTS
jgi:hypothetical protein